MVVCPILIERVFKSKQKMRILDEVCEDGIGDHESIGSKFEVGRGLFEEAVCDLLLDDGLARFVEVLVEPMLFDAFKESESEHELLAEGLVGSKLFEIFEWGSGGRFEVFTEVRSVFVTCAINVSCGAWAKCEPIFVLPVVEVVLALMVRRCEVGDFVVVEVGLFEGLDGVLVHLSFEIFFARCDSAELLFFCEWGVWFVHEAIAGEVVGFER